MTGMESWPAGKSEELHPLIRRLLAPNPSAFTYTGTQSYIVGRGEVAIIDPGPDLPEHVDAILDALSGERLVAIVCTHTHRDHSPASRPLAEATGAPIVGCAALALHDEGPRADAEFDSDYSPDRVVEDGEALEGPGWTLEAVATPGHTSNHLCFALREADALFTGDHVMGWSTTIVSPPDGDMAAYLASLDRLLSRRDGVYFPAHGPAIEDPQEHLRRLIAHRQGRERAIVGEVERGVARIPQMVESIYSDIDPALHPAAARSVLAHLIHLEQRGLVRSDSEEWRLEG
jgi:glyoxylase-like metal-dependent hydrolase (beta-lactamase superfamily II)